MQHLRRLMLVVALGAALTAFAGTGHVFADDGDGGGAAPAEAVAPGPDTTIAEGQVDDEILPVDPRSTAMAEISSSLSSMLADCRPGATLVSVTPMVNILDPSTSTLIVATRGESDAVMDEPVADLIASCTASASDYVAAVTQGETDLFSLLK